MNIIGIDSSKSSTAMAIKSKKGFFLFSYNTKEPGYKWIKQTSDKVKYYHYKYEIDDNDDYSASEVKKLIKYSYISNIILKDALEYIDKNDPSTIKIEGYSYGSMVGDLVDLVGIGQSIRIKLIEKIPNIEKIDVIAPKKLKTLCCEYTYGKPKQAISEKTGKPLKKWIPSRNTKGIVGGDFIKHDMFEALKDGNVDHPLKEFYKDNFEQILGMKQFIKPFEDINDAIWLVTT